MLTLNFVVEYLTDEAVPQKKIKWVYITVIGYQSIAEY